MANATELAIITEMFIFSEVACSSAIGELPSVYVAIAVSNRVKCMRNGNLN